MITGRLKNLRTEKKLSQKEFAQSLKVSQQTVASWESGRTEPSNNSLRAIADYFDVSVDYLLGRDAVEVPALSRKHKTILADFDALSPTGQNLLLKILSSLRVTHSTSVNATRNSQKNLQQKNK